MANESMPRYPLTEPVDFVIVGAGAAGGILARELSVAGFSTVVLEQGPHRQSSDFTHDELDVFFGNSLGGGAAQAAGQTFRDDESKTAEASFGPSHAWYAAGIGGSSVHFTGNLWRLREIDFVERSALGSIAGTNFADWPITYDDLEPYYTRVDWEIGVSGAPGPFDPPRSKPYPLPPMPVKSSGVLLEKGAKAIGFHAQPAPVAILSQPYKGRSACINCGFCLGFGCEAGAKSSTLVAMFPEAIASGNCELRPGCTVYNIATGDDGRVTEVQYLDGDGNERGQKARAAVISANGAETPRLLLMSTGSKHPDGLANSSGYVGRNLMFNAHGGVTGVFEHPLHDYKGVQATRIVHDLYESDPKRGFYGGGGFDARPMLGAMPILYALASQDPSKPGWGADFKNRLAHNFTRQMSITVAGTSLPLDRNNISLDPEKKDHLGRPAMRVTYRDHDDDLANVSFMLPYAEQMMSAAGAVEQWTAPVRPATSSPHLLGTCRMGNDPATSVIDRNHRAHDVPNLYICDGSSMVTSGRGQPTMTIMAMAFRAAEGIAAAARAGDI